MAFLEIHQVRRQFASQVAVENISFTADKGEFISLLGPSGSGKTTLLRIVAGFERPDAGRIVVDGEDVTMMPPQRRNMGMVFQSYALFPNMTAANNVAFGLRTRKVPNDQIQARVRELLSLVGLEQKADRYPHQLSGGEQQRVALARALAPNPRVLLLDEPLSALDALIRVNLRGEIRRIQQTLGITTLYVTHDQEEALAMSDRIVVFNHGRAEQIGTPEEIYDRPTSAFVSSFVGAMNRLTCQVISRSAGTVALGNHELQVNALPNDVTDGDRVELWIRPERIRLGWDPDDVNQNHLQVVVDQVMFLGARLGIKGTIVGGGGALTLDVPRDANDRGAMLRPGASVDVTFSRSIAVTRASE
ncbi:MAG: ABC transporter ATP-binding protein [Firmicutes bacterium]|nr:ABC transporter ATP-binding protein [Bacillota bacterium]